jgi:hypothetical protein
MGERMPPEKLEDLKAAIEGRPNTGNWEEMDPDEITEEAMTDDEYNKLLLKLHDLFVAERPPHELALRAATHIAVGLAVAELGMDAAEAKTWFSKATDTFIVKLEAYDANRHEFMSHA